ncbi:MAG: hypothetical protein JWP94_1326 [Mucilaginibacter sp.]|nr:hypothetical protein [Mucilaginibacter sp.]
MGYWHKGSYMNTLKPVRLTHLKTQAAFLLKDLCSDTFKSEEAAARILKLPGYSERTLQWVIDHRDSIKLKDALLTISMESGFPNWAELKKHIIDQDSLYRSPHVGLIYAWFSNYDLAAAYHRQHGGYLLCFWKDFVICGEEYIKCLSLSQYVNQWKSISYDWVKPADRQAWEFLRQKAAINYLNQP